MRVNPRSKIPRVRPLLCGLVATCAVIVAPLLAQTPGAADPRARFNKQAPQPAQAVTLRAVPQHETVRPGDSFAVAVVLTHAPGWHTWPEARVELPADVDESAIRTTIGADEHPTWVSQFGTTQYPQAHPGPVADPSGARPTVNVPLYSDEAVAFVPVRVAPGATDGDAALKIRVRYQSCNDSVCLMPVDETVEIRIRVAKDAPPVSESGAGPLFASMQPLQFETRSDVTDARSGATLGAPGEARAAPAPLSVGGSASRPSIFGLQLPDPSSLAGLLVLGMVSALGGLVLNLTPCVLPVIPIKILTLTQHAGSHGRGLVLGLWMALGVVAFWAAAGVPMAFLNATLDPSRLIFGHWQVTLGLGLVIALMGLGIMGLFQFNLPQSVYMFNPKADTAWGSFVFGAMTAVLGLPCFGFVAGGLLAGAATLPATTILVIFVGMGAGMAAPYLVLSARPGLLKFIPRTGPASELIKQVMGLLLLAAAAFFITAAIRGLLHERPYLADAMGWWAVAFFVGMAALWLSARTLQIARGGFAKFVVPLASILVLAGFVVFANGLSSTAREDYRRRALAERNSDALVTGAWVPYTPERFERARASGKVVLVDFTADWCVNCKFLKRTVLDSDAVRDQIVNDDHVMLEVDLTSSTASGWKFLADLGKTGIPTLAIFGPGLTEPVVYNAYTPDIVTQAVRAARRATPVPSTLGAREAAEHGLSTAIGSGTD
ncbi:MAG: thioredoxin family protein [Phycisphaerae bacterium]|nr:thioredoxin family protein [Phycisphaerae bacterium]